ncbi:RDD family protein [Peribacillus asahii]|uniref:RDD family protein n=1 Tax=Peribacillus asahii TaxID=228899 RepID=A0A398B980_9BACI|nr:RDD family protein [Peribacillus asahii]RID86535.1 RDD family protein [Peribacillus asahii]
MYCQKCGHEATGGDFCQNCGTILNETERTKYAGFWIRLVASMIDGIIIGIPIFIIALMLGVFSLFSTGEISNFESSYDSYSGDEYYEQSMTEFDVTMLIIQVVVWVLSIVIGILYYAGMHASKWQGTLGKMIVGIKVTDLNGQRISFLRALGRYFATILSSILYIGYIIAAFTEKKQSLHDFVAKTVVVYKR